MEGGCNDAQDSPDASDEDEDISQSWVAKRKPTSLRMLDSDDDTNSGKDGDDSDDSPRGECDDLFKGDGVLGKKLLVDTVESSMPPLRLSSVEDESNLPSPLATPSSPHHTPPPNPHLTFASSSTQPTPHHLKSLTASLADDSGIGNSLKPSAVLSQSVSEGSLNGEEDEVLVDQMEEGEGEGEEEGERKGGVLEESSVSVATDGDSLELSFQWGQSLPLAQPCNPGSERDVVRKKPSLLRDGSIGTQLGEESQWQATPTDAMQSQLPSQSIEEEDETQFLDEDG